MSNRDNKWKLYGLDDPSVCVLNPKKSEVRHLADSTIVTFVPMAKLDEVSGTFVNPSTRSLGEVRKGYTYFREGDVVFAKITPCMENGKSAVARDLVNDVGFGTTEFHVLRPGPLTIPEWIHLYVRQSSFREAARKSMCGGAGQQRVPIEFLKETRMPVPSVKEQRRIVARIAAVTRRADQARRLTLEREDELDALLKATYSKIIQSAERNPLEKVASLVRRKVDTQPDEEYEEMGVRSFGKGTFKKPVLTGLELGNKRIYYIHEGDLVFNNVFSWEGAIAVAQPEDHGRVGSHRFITYVPFEGEATSEFLCHHFLSQRGLEDIRAASPGSAGRNRTLGLKTLEKINVPVPGYEEQLRFQEIAKRRREIRKEMVEGQQALTAYRASVIAKAFRGEL